MEKKQVSVDALQFGMFVSELDRPWTETPFMFQGFHLRTAVQLAALKKHCKHVFVDPEKSDAPGKTAPSAPTAAFKIRGGTAYPEKATVEVEFKQAQTAFAESEKA